MQCMSQSCSAARLLLHAACALDPALGATCSMHWLWPYAPWMLDLVCGAGLQAQTRLAPYPADRTGLVQVPHAMCADWLHTPRVVGEAGAGVCFMWWVLDWPPCTSSTTDWMIGLQALDPALGLAI